MPRLNQSFLVSFREVADVLFLVEHLPIKKFFKAPQKVLQCLRVHLAQLRDKFKVLLWSEVINEEVFIDKGRGLLFPFFTFSHLNAANGHRTGAGLN